MNPGRRPQRRWPRIHLGANMSYPPPSEDREAGNSQTRDLPAAHHGERGERKHRLDQDEHGSPPGGEVADDSR